MLFQHNNTFVSTCCEHVHHLRVFTGVVVVFLFSCSKGHLHVVQYIVQQNASTTQIKNQSGDTPLHYACW